MADIKRVNYFNFQFLEEDEFRDEQSYHLSMRRSLNRALHTWGVAEGLSVNKSGDREVEITLGMAIDGQGQEIILTESKRHALVTSTPDKDVYLTLAYQEIFDEADKTTSGGVENYSRLTERPKIEDNAVVPPADGSVVPLAKIRLDSSGNIDSIDPSIRPLASAKIAPGTQIPGPLTIAAALKVEGDIGATGGLRVEGDVGIGTQTPGQSLTKGAKLEVHSEITDQSGLLISSVKPNNSGAMLHIVSTEKTTNSHRLLTGRKRNSSDDGWLDWTFESGKTDTPNLEFYRVERLDDKPAKTMRFFALTWDGKVGIGTTAPTAKLDVDGDLRVREPSSIGNVHLFLASEYKVLWSNQGGGDIITDVRQYVPVTAKGAVIKVIVLSTGGTGSFVVADRKGAYSNLAHYYQNGFTNYDKTNWAGGLVFCPFFDGKRFKWRTVSNTKNPDPAVKSYAALVGWF